MKKILAIILISLVLVLSIFSFVEARVIRVRGYYRPSTGTYVQPHYRTSPNRTKWDNWSTRGNINPYTGKRGYKSSWSW